VRERVVAALTSSAPPRSGSYDNTVRVWDTATGLEVAVLREHEGTVWAADMHPRGALCLSSEEKGMMRLWDCEGDGKSAELRGHEHTPMVVRFDPAEPDKFAFSAVRVAPLSSSSSAPPLTRDARSRRATTAALSSGRWPSARRCVCCPSRERAPCSRWR
jgi:WD40 repeat protein